MIKCGILCLDSLSTLSSVWVCTVAVRLHSFLWSNNTLLCVYTDTFCSHIPRQWTFVFFFHFLATVNKAALNIHVQGFVFIFILFNSFWPCLAACGILVPWPGVKPTSPALGAWSVSHWTAGEVQVFDGDVFTSTGHTPKSGAAGSRCNSAPQTQLPWLWALPPQLSSVSTLCLVGLGGVSPPLQRYGHTSRRKSWVIVQLALFPSLGDLSLVQSVVQRLKAVVLFCPIFLLFIAEEIV